MRPPGRFRRRRDLLLPAVLALTVLSAAPSTTAGATAPPPPPPAAPPPSTAPPSTVVAAPAVVPEQTTTSTVAGSTTVPLPTIPRAGSSIGGLRRDSGSPLTLARIAPLVVVAIAGLAAAGHVFGRVRSVAPRRVASTALARRD